MDDINKMLDVPETDEPPMNAAMEQCLAMSGYDPASREMTLQAWLTIGFEHLARERGRERAGHIAQQMLEFVRTAKPSRPWPK